MMMVIKATIKIIPLIVLADFMKLVTAPLPWVGGLVGALGVVGDGEDGGEDGGIGQTS